MAIEQLLFTYRPPGKGFDPKECGFQIAACSPGLDGGARDLLKTICMHYGDAIHSHAPQEARDNEDRWRASRENAGHTMPAEVLAAFPVAWAYDRLAGDQFALTRVHYTGFCPETDAAGSWRNGNFLAHAFVFSPAALASHQCNPLTLARALPFADRDDGATTQLPSLPDFAGLPTPSKTTSERQPVLRAEPLRQRLAAMAVALAGAGVAARPVVLCLTDWRQAAVLAELLLDLVPPEVRSRTTLATYESRRDWVPRADVVRASGMIAAHHLLVLGGAESHATTLRPDEVRGKYAVFNFVGSQFSDLDQPRPWAVFAAAAATEGRWAFLDQYYGLLSSLRLGRDQDVWDRLVPAAALLEDEPVDEAVVAATTALATLALEPDQARLALDKLKPQVCRLAEAHRHGPLRAMVGHLAALRSAATNQPGNVESSDWDTMVQERIVESLAIGWPRTADALLDALGAGRPAALGAALVGLLDQDRLPLTFPDVEDGRQVIQLLLEALPGAAGGDASGVRLLLAAFRAAGHSGLAQEVWDRIGRTHVEPQLQEPWSPDKQDFAASILQALPLGACPAAEVWLWLRLIENMALRGDALADGLEKIAAVCSRCVEGEQLTDRVIAIAAERFADAEARAVQLGRMAQAALGTTVQRTMFQAYRDAVTAAGAKRNSVHRKLAQASAVQVLAEEAMAETVPWDPDFSPGRLQVWRDEVLNAQAHVLEALCNRVAESLREPRLIAEVLPLAEQLLPKKPPASPPPGALALYVAIVLGLPMKPPANPWRRMLQTMPDGLPANAAARWRILQFMVANEERAREGEWSPATFPCFDAAWKKDARELTGPSKEEVLAWCLGSFCDCGVTTAKDAAGLMRLLEAVGEGSAERIARAVCQLLSRRDRVTWVLAATACVDAALSGYGAEERWGHVVGGIVRAAEPMVPQLFLSHLDGRFDARTSKRQAQIERLCVHAGLRTPAPAPLAAGTLAEPGRPRFRLGQTIRRWLQRLIGRPGSLPPPERKRNRKRK